MILNCLASWFGSAGRLPARRRACSSGAIYPGWPWAGMRFERCVLLFWVHVFSFVNI